MGAIKLKNLVIIRLCAVLFTVAFLTLTLHLSYYSETISRKEAQRSAKVFKNSCPKWKKWTKEVRQCLLKGLQAHSAWYVFDELITTCVDKESLRLFNIRVLTNIDDTKLAILDFDDDPCTVLTLGINKDIRGERMLYNAMPQCRFFGVDPIPESGTIYKNIGHNYDWAVSNETWFRNLTVKINGTKFIAEVPVVGLYYLTNEIINSSIIDFIFMNIGGYEYEILPQMHYNSRTEHDAVTGKTVRPTICQMTVELHGPPGAYGLTKQSYDSLLYDFVKYSPFVPLWTRAHDRHTKVYFFNADSRLCVEKYLADSWCKSKDNVQ